MTFEDAMKALKEGKNVRYKSWYGQSCLEFPYLHQVVKPKMITPNSELLVVGAGNAFITKKMRESDDWEIVDEAD